MSIFKSLNTLFNDNTGEQRAKLVGLYAFLIGFNIFAWVWAFMAFSDDKALLGTAFLAYLFGLRHAVDSDHIAAIDNVVRKLMQEGRKPITVGFFFSLGHSTVVLLASAALAAAIGLSQGRLEAVQEIAGIFGTAVSALFLMGIGVANLFVLKGLWQAFRRQRLGEVLEPGQLENMLLNRGF